MKKLTQSAFQRAKDFIMHQGRALDQRRFEFHFEDGPADAILAALTPYQNDDGGFAHSLEPDIRTPFSSAIVTTVGFQILREIRAPASHILVRKGIQYFIATYEVSQQVWPIVPPEVDDAPHAPWWDYENSSETFGQFLVNPRAEIVGYLHEFSDGVPMKLLKTLTTAVLGYLDSLSDEMEMHDSLCFVRLAETEALPNRDKVWAKLAQVAAHSVARNAEQLTGYVLKPLWLVSSPESPLAAGLKDEVEMNLDFEIEQQGEDGSWSPNFSWGDQYPEAWRIAKREWQSRFTVDTLKTLKDFGRIEQMGK
ncbi:hypothetical protein C6503_21675 [Candidatus Poribacteria bacterium]|nr:MAG: hypothetical protein C6503_21675 [Candidatus Poribacteria bacterium]